MRDGADLPAEVPPASAEQVERMMA